MIDDRRWDELGMCTSLFNFGRAAFFSTGDDQKKLDVPKLQGRVPMVFVGFSMVFVGFSMVFVGFSKV